MSQTILNQDAIAAKTKKQQTQLFLLSRNKSFPSKLVALWRLDEHAKLYCQWVQE